MIKKLVSHLGEYKRAAVLTPLFAALEAVMDVLLPTIMAFIIDLGIEKGDMHAIVKYGLLTFLVAAIALLLGVLAGKYAAEASTGFAGNLRDAMYENIQHYSFSNIDKFSTAGLVTRMTTDVTNVQNAFQMIERMCVRAPVHLVFALFMAVVIGGPLSLVFVVHGSTGWKLAEYVAAGRAIVTEPLRYTLPGGFEEGKNYKTYTSPAQCEEQLRQLLADPAAILAMAQHNADYYQMWLRPEQQVRQALRQLETGEL